MIEGPLRQTPGFSLAELLVSVVILSIGVLGFASAVGIASTEMRLGARDTDVAVLLWDQLERLKADGYQDVGSGTRSEGDYELSWVIEEEEGLKRIVMVASFPTMRGETRSDTVVAHLSP